jgi:hypothetical protein
MQDYNEDWLTLHSGKNAPRLEYFVSSKLEEKEAWGCAA